MSTREFYDLVNEGVKKAGCDESCSEDQFGHLYRNQQGVALWSYSELITTIGLEAMYRGFVNACIRGGIRFVGRDEWINIPVVVAMRPPMCIAAVQAGVELLIIQSQNPEPRQPSNVFALKK
jgi:hypothetical protein